MGLPRWVHRVRARLGGYFWLPCPKCGRMFGGHEHGPTLWDDETRTLGKGLCRLHERNEVRQHHPACRHPLYLTPDGTLYEDRLTGDLWQKRDGVWLIGRLVFVPPEKLGE